jgi:hypothetical protein
MSSCAFEERHDLARAALQGRGHRGRDAALVLGAAVSSSAMEPRDAGVWMETTAHAWAYHFAVPHSKAEIVSHESAAT